MNKKKIIFVAAIVFLVTGAYFVGMGQNIPNPNPKVKEIEPVIISEVIPPASCQSEEQTIFVHVCGCVSSPGVYELLNQARVKDAVDKAGGYTKDAASEYLNLARFVKDGEQLYVPSKEEAKGQESSSCANESSAPFVNINTANQEELLTLPGIGEAKANAIIAYRKQYGDFKKPEDIMKVSGIKEAAFLLIKGYITVN